MKWLSRKFFMSILVIFIAVILKSQNQLGDWATVCLILVMACVYMLINGAIRIEYLKIAQKDFTVELKGKDEEN